MDEGLEGYSPRAHKQFADMTETKPFYSFSSPAVVHHNKQRGLCFFATGNGRRERDNEDRTWSFPQAREKHIVPISCVQSFTENIY